jgi:hypothetical protein
MALRWLSALRYGSGPTTWTATVPSRPWTKGFEWVGGTLQVASGAREAFTINTLRDIDVLFRVKESEYDAFMLAVAYGVENPGTLTFYPNGVAATGYLVDIISPTHGEKYAPARSGQMGSASTGEVFECPVTFRKVDGTAWALNYFAP